MIFKASWPVYVGFAMLLAGCAAGTSSQSPIQQAAGVTSTPAENLTQDDSPVSRETLWTNRVVDAPAHESSPGFTLGPGDVLGISVPQIPQLRNRKVMVSEQNTIALPLVGIIDVSGMTQQDLLNDLTHRLRKYMYQPQVAVFLEHSESRAVAVLGAVKAPGRYMMTSRSDSIMTMISRAGGTTGDAGAQIILIPGPVSRGQVIVPKASSDSTAPELEYADARDPKISDVALHDSADPLTTREHSEQVVISTSRAEDRRYFEVPVRPGDVIIVPAAGQVTVQGWVDKPGAFPVTPGLTVLGSVAAAGGALFSTSATLLREEGNGHKVNLPLDLSKIKSGEQPDVAVRGGDVVVVERSVAGAVPYSLYFLIQKIGIGIPLIP
jgi:polysaccharide biosynthesis/export protein